MMRLRLLIVIAAIALPAAPSLAASATCVASTANVVFGTYNPMSTTAATATGSVTVACTMTSGISLVTAYTIALSKGLGSYTTRTVSTGSSTLNYNLYTGSSYATIWGDGTASTSTVNDGYLLGISTVTRNYPVYGRMPALQNAAAGDYSDTIIVTVTY